MNTHEEADLKEWMATWKNTGENRLTWMREDFTTRRLTGLMKDFGAMAAFAAAGLVLIGKAVSAPHVLSITAAAFFGPYFFFNIWLLLRKTRARRGALPLSGGEYIASMQHNLELEKRELQWERRTLPIALLVGSAVVLTTLLRASSWMSNQGIGLFVLVLISGFGYALWSAFVDKPKRLHREAQTLKEMVTELTQTPERLPDPQVVL